jgi:hypothetical protein
MGDIVLRVPRLTVACFERPYHRWDILPWLSGVPVLDRDRHLIMVMQAYVDDSGKDDPPLYVLGGYIARAEQWARFSDQWKAALDESGLSHFKMQDAFTLSGEFKGWTQDRRDEALRRFASIIRDNVLAAISATVMHDDYKEVFSGRVTKFLDRAYLFLFSYVQYSAMLWQIHNNFDEPIDFIFDEQLHDSDIINDKFGDMLSSAPGQFRKRAGSRPVHASDKIVLPLQAADMFAWHVRRVYYERGRGSRVNTAAIPILNEISHEQTHLSKERLVSMLQGLSAEAASRGTMYPYEIKAMIENMDRILSMSNAAKIAKSSPGDLVSMTAIPASGMSRFRFVHSCPRVRTSHLHRKAGDDCLGES